MRKLGCIDLFFAIPFWENFGKILIVADGFWDMLINSVLQSYFHQYNSPAFLSISLRFVDGQ